MDERCFHCGRALDGSETHALVVDGVPRPMCCGGCEAAARLIHAQGLERYYAFRDGATPPADPAARDWTLFDRDAALRRYSHLRADGRREASLRIDGMHCAACGWLIENSVRALEGVVDVQVNPSGARAELTWDPRRIALSRVLGNVHRLGYLPRLRGFAGGADDGSEERRTALKRLGVAGFAMMQVMTYAVALYAGAFDGIEPDIERLLRFVSLLVTTPVVLYSAQPFFAGAWRTLRARTLGMDVPVALSIAAAWAWSVWTTLRGHGAVYFDSVVMFTFFLLVGRYVEAALRQASGRERDAWARLLPDGVTRITAETEERITPDELTAGDRVRVLPGERIPADGVILSGRTEVDESLLTGESAPQLRAPGDPLIAGTLNTSGSLEMRVNRAGQDSTLAAAARLLERAQASRPRIADAADRVAAWFVGGVLLIAVCVAVYWLRHDAARAFPAVLAVLVVTCPCALSLATPAALAAATTRLARSGLLVTRGRAIETLARVQHVIFDKTGTLTRGVPRIDELRILSRHATPERCLAIAAALERRSEHPVARAFAAIDPAPDVSDVTTEPGCGVEGRAGGVLYRIGRTDYVQDIAEIGPAGRVVPDDDARTTLILGDTSGPLAAFFLADRLREDAPAALQALRALGLETSIASGDRAAVVARVARRLDGIDARAGASAQDKLALVRALQARGRVVAMVGDGVNDAPVLAGADVSVAIGSGTDLAKVSADLVMPGAGLAPLAHGIEIARRTLRIVRENLAWAVLYNTVAVPLAASGRLAPWMAALGMSCSSLLVVANALRLLRAQREPASASLARDEVTQT